MKPLEIIGAGLLLSWLFKSAGNSVVNKLQVQKIKIDQPVFTFDGAHIDLYFTIKNNGLISLPLDGFSGVLKYGDTSLSSLSISQSTTLEAGSISVVPASAFIGFAQLANELLDLIQSGDFLNGLYVKGNLISSSVNIPINQPITLQ